MNVHQVKYFYMCKKWQLWGGNCKANPFLKYLRKFSLNERLAEHFQCNVDQLFLKCSHPCCPILAFQKNFQSQILPDFKFEKISSYGRRNFLEI
jgi:hypothetical protein